jgi:nucleoside-diphosphate-sugar epimerase
MRALILGCGYLGERVARLWQAGGCDVHAVTRRDERARTFQEQGWTSILADVTDTGSLVGLPAADVVLYAVGREPRRTSQTMREVALDGLNNVLDVLVGRVERFLFISSTSVYGQSQGEWVDEQSICEPIRENGRVLVTAESLVHQRMGPAARVLRLAGIYGPGRLIARIETLREGVVLSGHPEAWLNLVHVDDAAASVVASAERAGSETTWLVSDDRPVQRQEYFGRLAELVSAPPPRFDPERVSPRTSGLNKRCRNQRLKDELGVELLFPSFAEGLPHAVDSEKSPPTTGG